MTLTFTVPGKPEPQRRARATARHGHVRMVDDPRNRTYADRIRWAWRDAGSPAFGDTPVVLAVTAYFPRPATHFRKNGELTASGARAGHYYPGTPDGDNLAKAIMDALNGYAWADDRYVVRVAVEKRWAEDRVGRLQVMAEPALAEVAA